VKALNERFVLENRFQVSVHMKAHTRDCVMSLFIKLFTHPFNSGCLFAPLCFNDVALFSLGAFVISTIDHSGVSLDIALIYFFPALRHSSNKSLPSAAPFLSAHFAPQHTQKVLISNTRKILSAGLV